MDNVQVEENAIYCKRINGVMICYRVIKVCGNGIRLKNIDNLQPEFATTAEKLINSQYIRTERLELSSATARAFQPGPSADPLHRH